MARVRDLITVQISHDPLTDTTPTWTDYTDGVLNIDILRGIQSDYEGPYQQIESGVLTLVSRNENLDPHQNSNIRMNKRIRVKADTEVIFTGRISGINVDYQAKGKPPIITLNAVDMVGTMALHTLRDTFKSRLGSTMNMFGMFQELVYASTEGPTTSEIIGFTNPFRNASGSWGNAANASTGTTALTMATKLGQSDLHFFYADRNNDMYLYDDINYKRDDAPKLQFDSRGGATNYKAIELTDGFDLLKNQVSIAAQTTTIPLYTNTYSVDQWGPQKALIDTYLPSTTQDTITNALATAIFQETANPTREIKSITFDGEKAVDEVHHIDILDNVYIYHEVDGFDIERKYGIIGIHHIITENDWEITYKLRNMFTYETVFPTPIISVSPSSGTIVDTYTFSITNINDIETENATYIWKDNTVQFSTAQSPTKTYTLAQVGAHSITCTVTDSYGFTKTSAPITLNVYGAAPTGVSFTYSVDPSNSALIEFVATATNATSYSWDFGDSTSGTGQTTAHLYSTSGNKTVVLTATNAYGSTTSTQTIAVTVPPAPVNETGTQGVRYLKFGMDSFNASGYYWPLMRNFTAKTSTTLTDRAASCYIQWGLPYQTSGQTWGNHEWRKSDNTAADVPNSGSCTSVLLRTGSGGLKPYNTITGTANWGLVVDLGDIYYDVKTLNLGFSGTAASGAPTFINVYATTYTASGIADGSQSPNAVTWTKIGTISRSTGAFTPVAGKTMPLDIGEV